MDVGLGHAWQVAKEFADMAVLILVLVDVGLGPGESIYQSEPVWRCLNPCFSGCWSRTRWSPSSASTGRVLILVLVDVGLGLAPGSSTPVDVRQKS